ncbi:MAG TPA: response regulator [Stenomitos sp.]
MSADSASGPSPSTEDECSRMYSFVKETVPVNWSNTKLQILLLEDDPTDSELIEVTLRNGGIEGNLIFARDQESFLEQLNTSLPDLILSDYTLPKFNGIAALELAKATCPSVPFILVSGVLGEEKAISALKQGATDYVLKHRLERLVPAVQRALRESQERQERQKLTKALHQTDNLLRAIIDASPLGIIMLSREQRIITWNATAEQLYGWPATTVVDGPFSVMFPAGNRDNFNACFTQALQGHRICNREVQHVKQDGTLMDVSLSLAPLYDADDSVYGVVITAVDITARKQIEAQRIRLLEQEKAARVAAETTNRIKDEFLGVLSHELRTPLSAIIGWIKLIQKKNLSGMMLQCALDTIERNASTQTQLIEDLLDISHMIRGQVSLQIQPTDVTALLQTVVDSLRPAAAAKSLQIQVDLAPSIQHILADPNRLQQVFWNLLSNAIKFTNASGKISVTCHKVQSYLNIQVSDSGIGIAPEFLPYVFECFRQADGSTTRSQSGLGLGLAITRHLVELHGGTIQAESRGLGSGSTFTVLLPMCMPQAEPELTPPCTETELDLQGIKAIIVDDDRDDRELMTFALEQEGAEVQSTANATDALALLQHFSPDVLISDIGMPDTDGYAFLQTLRTHPNRQWHDIPAIALTAYTRGEDRERALAVGFQAHLTKPCDPLEVVTLVHQLSHRNR